MDKAFSLPTLRFAGGRAVPSGGAPRPRWCVRNGIAPRVGAHGAQALQRETVDARLTAANMTRDEFDAQRAVAATNGVEDRGVFVVGFGDAVAVHEIEPPNHADAVGHALHRRREFVVARRRDQRVMQRLVEFDEPVTIGDTLGAPHFPRAIERVEQQMQFGLRRLAAAQLAHREGFDHLAHFVEIVETLVVDRHDFPAAAHIALHQAVALQPLQRFARGRARDRETLSDRALGEPVSRQQVHIENFVAQRVIDAVRPRQRGVRCDRRGRRAVVEREVQLDVGHGRKAYQTRLPGRKQLRRRAAIASR
ncbi:hypothetical protein PT2222_260081 [Paraburkholderia tropica]